ncbi:MAG: hypothetical protein K2L52_05910, partial [Clostridia bacterium]|nr:hypothetical protein [Clostridia bacterium]
MNSKKIRAKYLKFAILIISVCFILGAISACLPLNISVPTLEDNVINDTAVTITTNPTDGLGEFNDGYSYVYTDKTLIDKYRAGDTKTPYDMSIMKVAKTSDNRGSQENPYVISTEDEWITFVKWVATTGNNYGSGKYFVLASDLDFDASSVEFQPVAVFNGTFYGMGHTIKNAVPKTWQYWNGSNFVDIGTTGVTNDGYGLFCEITGATITDLVLENYIYPTTTIKSTFIREHGPYLGGIAGLIYTGENAILNCHADGVINNTASGHTFCGGIGGLQYGDTKLIIYRCSAKLTATLSGISSREMMFSGVLGRFWSGGTASSRVFDCVANVKGEISGYMRWRTGAVGNTYTSASLPFQIENFVGSIDLIASSVTFSSAGLHVQTGSANLTNCYVDGTWATSGVGAKNSLYVYNDYATISNVNSVVNSNGLAGSGHNGNIVSSTDALVSSAKTFFGANYSQIWDTSKIGADYSPDNSPVRNYLMAFVNFRNLNDAGKNEEKVGLDDGELYVAGDKLPDEKSDVSAFTTYLNNKANSNHIFKGWTDDPTGESEPFAKLPSGLYGDVTLYAVWGLPDSYVTSNIKTSLTSDKNLIEYDSVESITLTAKVEHIAPSSGAMTNPSAMYYFMQDGEDKTTTATVKNSGVLSVKTVKDSGKYTFKYRLTDGLEPLWY